MPKTVRAAGLYTHKAQGAQGWLRMTAAGRRFLGRGFSLGLRRLPRHRLFGGVALTGAKKLSPSVTPEEAVFVRSQKPILQAQARPEPVGRDRRMMNCGRRGGRSLVRRHRKKSSFHPEALLRRFCSAPFSFAECAELIARVRPSHLSHDGLAR